MDAGHLGLSIRTGLSGVGTRRRILKETGRLLSAFLLGSATTVVGSAVAMLLFPLSPYLGDAGWRIASALTARHIGGAVNYMAVSDMLDIPASATSACFAGVVAHHALLWGERGTPVRFSRSRAPSFRPVDGTSRGLCPGLHERSIRPLV